VLTATGAKAYNILQNNGTDAHQVVMHVHFHIIPKLRGGSGLGLVWRAHPLDEAEGAEVARRISACIEPE
jgi:histidine triad (HIT) family protein